MSETASVERAENGEFSLAKTLISLLKEEKRTLSVAESFTGGNVSKALISVPGASAVFFEGLVCYHSDSKHARLGVKRETLANFGAVSAETAYEMAAGLLSGGRCDFAVATTGLAGPDSDEFGHPVGLYFIAVGDLKGIHVYRHTAAGDRKEITQEGVLSALQHAIAAIKNQTR